MNILRVTASMDPSMGGPPQGIRNSIAELERLGIRNEVVSCDAQDAAWLGQDDFSIHALGPGKYGFAYTPKLGPWLEENLARFDAVIVHGLWLWPSVCATRAIARHRRAVTSDEWRVTSGRTTDQGSDPLPVTRNPRLFVMPHGMLDPWFQRDKSRRVKAARNWFYWWLVERNVVNSADALLFTCQQELELARTTFGGYRPRREINVGYGIAEPPAFEPKMREAFAARCPGLNGRLYLLFMSRIHAKKNVAALVRAYTRVRSEVTSGEWRVTSGLFPDLVVAGPGWDTRYGEEVKRMIDEANGGQKPEIGDQRPETADGEDAAATRARHSAHIHAVGMLSGAAKWGALYGCEAFVLPSHQENFGIAVVEALACGKPVLISDQVNIWREIVEDGAGIAEADTEEGVEKLLRKFLSTQKDEVGDLRPEVRTKPRECYLKWFAIGPAAAKLAEALKGEV
jgi:glycosyltransferase involved in cell wall biosynthesis